MVVELDRMSCLGQAKIASPMFLVLFKDGGRRVSLRFLFFSDVKQGDEDARWVQDFLP